MSPLELGEWLPIYDEICRDFDFDKAKDLESARLLASMVGGQGDRILEGVRKGLPGTVLICGGSQKLAEELSSISVEGYVVAADGATTVLMEAGVRVDMIVTDLDGIIEDQIESNAKGAPVFLHAHGDNQAVLKRWTSLFSGPVVGTCQCPPPPGIFNFGGFTDGDRAACLCAGLGARTIRLSGFDFENPSEKPGKDREVKKQKLQWAKRIIDRLSSQGIRVVRASEQ
ncbi:MAG TPA: 6-hydroxymethylpterin diphosphokinase MptE-like protein [Thermoplasmata archaeon]